MIDEKPIGAALSRNLGGRSAPGEKVEAELDVFISKALRASLERKEEPKQSPVSALIRKAAGRG